MDESDLHKRPRLEPARKTHGKVSRPPDKTSASRCQARTKQGKPKRANVSDISPAPRLGSLYSGNMDLYVSCPFVVNRIYGVQPAVFFLRAFSGVLECVRYIAGRFMRTGKSPFVDDDYDYCYYDEE